ncbi:hypothetical protein Tco_0607723 [Tanacetum coccineum]
MTNLRNEITRFQQRFDESFYEAWDRFNDLLRACPHHGFSELHQLDTFYNALNANDQDSLNSAAGGNFLDKMPRECLRIIESKSKVRNSRNMAQSSSVVAKVSSEFINSQNFTTSAQAPAPVKAVEQSYVTCRGAHSYKNYPATNGNIYQDNIQEYVSQAAAANFNQGNTNFRPPMVANQIRPPGFPPIQNNQNRFNQNQGNNFNQNRGTNSNQNRGNNFYQGQVYQPPTSQPPVFHSSSIKVSCSQVQCTEDVQPPVVPVVHHESISEPVNAPVSASMPNQKASIPFPSRRNDERRREKANDQIEKFYEIFRDLSFKLL